MDIGRAPLSNGSIERTELSDSEVYSSSADTETSEDENIVVDSPVCFGLTREAKRNGMGKTKMTASDEYEELKSFSNKKLLLMEESNNILRQKLDLKIIMADTTVMNSTQKEIHAMMLEEVKSRRL